MRSSALGGALRVSTQCDITGSLLTPTYTWLVQEAMCRNVVHLIVLTQARKAVRKVYPRTDQDSAGRHRHTLVAQYHKHTEDHTTASRITGQYNGVWVMAFRKQVQVSSKTVL